MSNRVQIIEVRGEQIKIKEYISIFFNASNIVKMPEKIKRDTIDLLLRIAGYISKQDQNKRKQLMSLDWNDDQNDWYEAEIKNALNTQQAILLMNAAEILKFEYLRTIMSKYFGDIANNDAIDKIASEMDVDMTSFPSDWYQQ